MFNLNSSAVYPGNVRFRNEVREEMRQLVEKYPDGYEGYAKEHGLNLNAGTEAGISKNMEPGGRED